MNKDNKIKKGKQSDKKLHISDVMGSLSIGQWIVLGAFIWYIIVVIILYLR